MRPTFMCTTLRYQNANAHPATKRAQPAAGAKELTIVKNSRKLTAVPNVTRVGASGPSPETVAICSAPADAPVRSQPIAWWVNDFHLWIRLESVLIKGSWNSIGTRVVGWPILQVDTLQYSHQQLELPDWKFFLQFTSLLYVLSVMATLHTNWP